MGHVRLPMLLSSVDLSSSDDIDLEAGGPVNPSQNDPSLILRVILHYRYNYLLYFKPRWISLIGVNLSVHRSDLGRAFAVIHGETPPLRIDI